MASHHPAAAPAELDSGAPDSVSSTPRSILPNIPDDNNPAAAAVPPPRVRFMCSFGGKILPRPHDNQLRYVGSDTRIVAVSRHVTFATLLSKLSKLAGTANVSIKYQLPNEDLDALITITTDEDVENMMDEYDRLLQSQKSARLRVFLFPTDADSREGSLSSLLDGFTKREHWFVDALNGGGSGLGPSLERGPSEVSSIVSEVPDYLFGLDNSDDAPREPKFRTTKIHLSENHPGSDPGSPAPVVSSPFCSTASSLVPPSMPAIPDLPPVKTKPVNPFLVSEPGKELPVEMVVEGGKAVVSQQAAGYTSSPMWHYPSPTMQHVPAYYVPVSVRPGNLPVQSVPIGAPFVQQFAIPSGQMPIGFNFPVSRMGQVYGAGARPVVAVDPISGRVVSEGVNQPINYGVGSSGMVPNYQGMVVSGSEEIQVPGLDAKMGQVSQS